MRTVADDEAARGGPFRGMACVLCGSRPSTRRGEHVWPQWYLRAPIHAPGPYSWSLDKEPVRRPNGRVVAPDELTRVKLPVCRPCNAELQRRFETTSSEVILPLFRSRGAVGLTAEDAELAGLWLLKTWLLLSHPQVHYAEATINSLDIIRDREALPPHCYGWLVNGEEPPPGLSLWASRTVDDGPAPRSGPIIPLPEVHADGDVVRFNAHEVSLHGLTVVLVFHPGWPVAHPHETDGRAVRLWPAHGPVDLEGRDPILRSELPRWSDGWRVVLADGALASGDLSPIAGSLQPAMALLRPGRLVRSATRLAKR